MSRRPNPLFPPLPKGENLYGLLTSAIAFALLSASPARGVVEGSPHDLIAQGYDVQKESLIQERCTLCHLATSAAVQDLLPAVPPVLALAYSVSSLTCFSCHDGTTIVSPAVDASRTAFHRSSHGNEREMYEGLSGEVTGLPLREGNRMECVTCHDPHDNGHRPLLRADIGKICLACHSTLSEFGLGAQNITGNHPQGAIPAPDERNDVPITVASVFTTRFPASYPLVGGRASVGTHWDLGGHLSSGGEGTVVCVTCHAVHGDEDAPPRLPALLATDPVRREADLFCEGCHAGERGDGRTTPPRPNPGGTTTGRTYHPADDDRANGSESIVETRTPEGWPLGTAASRPIICSTCHRAHGATERTSLLRRPPDGRGFCEVCHERMSLAYHHPLLEKDAGPCSNRFKLVDPITGIRRTCEFCHRAHNAGFGRERESDHIPLLINPINSIESCTGCHPAGNPTCGTDPGHWSTHFMGDPTLEITYADAAPPLRTKAWPESGLLSMYGGENGKEIICLSCHSFKKGALVTGDDGTSRNLLARSGNGWEWAEGEESGYLCTGCHGSRPGTDGDARGGHTHPLMSANAAMLGRPVPPPLSATSSGKMNCESCHRPHEASTKAGSFILEVVEGANEDSRAIRPSIVYTVLCYGCHDEGKY